MSWAWPILDVTQPKIQTLHWVDNWQNICELRVSQVQYQVLYQVSSVFRISVKTELGLNYMIKFELSLCMRKS